MYELRQEQGTTITDALLNYIKKAMYFSRVRRHRYQKSSAVVEITVATFIKRNNLCLISAAASIFNIGDKFYNLIPTAFLCDQKLSKLTSYLSMFKDCEHLKTEPVFNMYDLETRNSYQKIIPIIVTFNLGQLVTNLHSN